MQFRRAIAALAATSTAVLWAGAGTAAFANADHGAGTVHEAENERQAVDTFADSLPCQDDLGYYAITTTYNEQFHDTENANGFWITSTQTGTFTAHATEIVTDGNGDPVLNDEGDFIPVTDPNTGEPVLRGGGDLETFSGKFVVWFGASVNPNESVETFAFTIHGVGDQGSTIDGHENAHVVTDGAGDPEDPTTPLKLAFDKIRCN